MAEKYYKGGYLSGLVKNYGEDGKLKSEENFAGGNKNGLVTMFFSDGKVMSETHYIKGDIHGTVKEYNDDGEVVLEAAYINNKKEGVAKTFYSKDKPSAEFTYVKGRLTSIKRFDVDGAVWMEGAPEARKKSRAPEELSEKELKKMSKEDKKLLDTRKGIAELRKFLSEAFVLLKAEKFKSMKKTFRKGFPFGAPFEAITDSNEVKFVFDGKGGFYLDGNTGEVFLNIKGKDKNGTPYYEY